MDLSQKEIHQSGQVQMHSCRRYVFADFICSLGAVHCDDEDHRQGPPFQGYPCSYDDHDCGVIQYMLLDHRLAIARIIFEYQYELYENS